MRFPKNLIAASISSGALSYYISRLLDLDIIHSLPLALASGATVGITYGEIKDSQEERRFRKEKIQIDNGTFLPIDSYRKGYVANTYRDFIGKKPPADYTMREIVDDLKIAQKSYYHNNSELNAFLSKYDVPTIKM